MGNSFLSVVSCLDLWIDLNSGDIRTAYIRLNSLNAPDYVYVCVTEGKTIHGGREHPVEVMRARVTLSETFEKRRRRTSPAARPRLLLHNIEDGYMKRFQTWRHQREETKDPRLVFNLCNFSHMEGTRHAAVYTRSTHRNISQEEIIQRRKWEGGQKHVQKY